MKKFVQFSALVACAILGFSNLISSPARADEGSWAGSGNPYYAHPDTMPVSAGNVPQNSASWQVPVRFGDLIVHEQNFGSALRYVVTYNGYPILNADNQPGALQVSQPFALDGEDAVIFTAYRAEENCPYRNYLVITRPDGALITPRQIDNCANANQSEIHVARNALFMGFSAPTATGSWDVWRYENTSLIRL